MCKQRRWCSVLIGLTIIVKSAPIFAQAGEFLRYGVGAKALAKGRIFTGIADDVSSLYWNPAGLAQLNQLYVGAMQSNLYFDTQYFFTGVATPLPIPDDSTLIRSSVRHTVGFGFVLLKNAGFELVDRFDQREGSFDIQEYALTGSYAINLVGKRGNLNFGFAPIYFRQDIQGESGGGWGFNAGLLYQPIFPGRATVLGLLPLKYIMPWRFGLNYRHLGSLKMGNESRDYDNSFNFGVSYTSFEDIIGGAIKLVFKTDPFASWPLKIQFPAYEFEKIAGRKVEHRLGGEARWRLGDLAILSGRAGYRFGRENFENKCNFGFGLQTDVESGFPMGFDIDFSLIDHPVLGSAKQFYVTLRLSDWLRNVRRAQKRDPAAIPEPQLWSLLSYYPFDDRVVKEGESLDVVYKDTVALQLYNLVTKKTNSSKNQSNYIADRLSDFIGRLCDEPFPMITCNNASNKEALKKYVDGCFKGKEKALSKTNNVNYLKLYLRAQLLLGESELVQEIIDGRHSAIKNMDFNGSTDAKILCAFASKETADCDWVLGNISGDSYLEIMMVLAKAVMNEEAAIDDSDALLKKYQLLVYRDYTKETDETDEGQEKKYENFQFPPLGDGILADDIMFVAAYHKSKNLNDPQQLRELFLPIALELPHTDLGQAIAHKFAKLHETGESIESAIQNLWDQYETLFKKNQVICKESLL
jgi:hypothetical protein